MAVSWTFQPTDSSVPSSCQQFPIVCKGTGIQASGAAIDSPTLTYVPSREYTFSVSVGTDSNTTATAGIWNATTSAWVGTPITVGASANQRGSYTFTSPASGSLTFRVALTPVVSTATMTCWFNGPQCEDGAYATAYNGNPFDFSVRQLPLEGHDGTVQTGASRANSTIDSGNVVVTTGVDFSRAYTNKNLHNVNSTVFASGDIFASSSAWKTNIPGSLPNMVSDVSLQWSATSSSISIWVMNQAATGNPVWTPPDGSAVISPTTGGTSGAPLHQFTSLASGASYYIVCYYNAVTALWTSAIYSSQPTDSQLAPAYADGGNLVVLATANTSYAIVASTGTGGYSGGGGTRYK